MRPAARRLAQHPAEGLQVGQAVGGHRLDEHPPLRRQRRRQRRGRRHAAGPVAHGSDELLERFDAADFAGRLAKRLSGGRRRRVDLAAGLIERPQLPVLDEPTTGLDPRSRQVVWSTVRELVGEGITLLLTTQYLEDADAPADDIVQIDHGRTVAGSPGARPPSSKPRPARSAWTRWPPTRRLSRRSCGTSPKPALS